MASQLCVICGQVEATTFDHVPPKGIFPKPRPNDLVTVPCCFSCNNFGSKHDEEFRVFLSLQLGMELPATRKLWKEGALRSIQHNQRLRNHIINSSRLIDVKSPAGIYLGKQRAVPMPIKAHNAVLDRTVRGLYFHHFGRILGSRVSCRVRPLNGLPAGFESIIKLMEFGSVGGDSLVYRYGRAFDSPLDSLWVILFYKRYLVFVETISKSGRNAKKARSA
ncbi:MAG: hypothetical protein WC696_03775 [Candidatus Methylopumilus sp.]